MISITEIASYVPEGFESNLDKFDKFGIGREFIDEKIGVYKVARKDAAQETSDLCVESFRRLEAKTEIDPAQVDCIVVCTQNPDGHGLPHTAAIVHGKLGLPTRCASFDISLGCSGYVYGLSLVRAFMEANGLRTGLLFTADPYSKIVDPDDKNTVLLFGDAAAVTLLSVAPNGADGHLVPKRFSFCSDGSLSPALCNRDGRLHMNGRAVFTYSATTVPGEITGLVESAGLSFDDFDLFLLHQGSRYIVETIRKRLNLAESKVPCRLWEQGNTVSSSIPLLLESHIHDTAAQRLLLCGFGVGLSTACGILERQPD
ncbi:MAG: ketoacyl-ACP synthase III [Rhodospirillaceae bacterium]|jgi:3-oxoacyl-[acyl-carrier-protein] synthase III|nr:ketoacyl-ACP synthase III [Rhodospirillaceae bacterium]MBT6118971.1 ketoacyl-ACP synthase III [Rhodospirillaceae bacterium]